MKDWIKNNWSKILLIVFGVVIIALLMNTTCTKRRLDIAENNLVAMNDVLHTYKLKNGELMYEKQGYIAKVGELEKFIGIKEKEIKDIEKQLKSAVATIAKLEGQLHADSLVMHDSVAVLPDSTAQIFFDYNDSWLSLDGTTNYNIKHSTSNTILNCIHMEIPLKVGTTEDNKWFATTPNPYVQFTSIEGANISKSKPKRHSIGFSAGLGLGVGYGICIPPSGGTVSSGITLGTVIFAGVSYTYKFIEF